MARDNIVEELKRTRNLLLEEKEEDLFLYRSKMSNTSFNERRKEGVLWYPVSRESVNYDAGERMIVKLTRQPEHRNQNHLFQSGKLISIFSNERENGEEDSAITGVVNSVRDIEMIVTLNIDRIPSWFDHDKLGIQLLFDEHAYKEMEYAITKVIESEEEEIVRMRNILLGDEMPMPREATTPYLSQLNKKQNDAIQLIDHSAHVSIVHGPPGTGKTTTIIQSILHTLKTENQILVCAPSNAAVDLLVEQLVSKGVVTTRIGHPARVEEDLLVHTLDAKTSHHDYFKELRVLKRRAEECGSIIGKYKRNFGPEEREQRRLMYHEMKKLKKEAEQLSFYITSDVIDKSQVIATTLVGASNRVLKGRKFSSVYIDEAAQALEPACWIPIVKGHRVVFAGDHFQLPPTIKSRKAAKGGLETTLFEKAIQRNECDVMLNEQYRMHKNIMKFSSDYFYKGELFANESVENQVLIPEDLAIEFVDTAGCGYNESMNSETKSLNNEEEAMLLIQHLDDYMALIQALNLEHDVENIGIISPYRSQASLIRRKVFKEKYLSDWIADKVTVNTVDSFQGQERDVVYISLVRSNEKGMIGFLEDIRRMNVAMTRAKKKLVVIGDSATICRHSFYNQFFDFVNEIGAYRSGFEWMK